MAGIQEWRFASNHFPWNEFRWKSQESQPFIFFQAVTNLRFLFQNIRLHQVVSIVIISPPKSEKKKKVFKNPSNHQSQQRSQVTCKGQVRWKFLFRHFQQVHQLPRRFRLWLRGEVYSLGIQTPVTGLEVFEPHKSTQRTWPKEGIWKTRV